MKANDRPLRGPKPDGIHLDAAIRSHLCSVERIAPRCSLTVGQEDDGARAIASGLDFASSQMGATRLDWFTTFCLGIREMLQLDVS